MSKLSARRRSDAGTVADPEHSLGLDRIVSAIAPGIAPEQTPPRENHALKDAVLRDGFRCVTGARGLVLAPPRQRRRDQAAIHHDRSDHEQPCDRCGAAPRRRARSLGGAHDPPSRSFARAISSSSDPVTPARPSRPASSPAPGRATTTTSCPARRFASVCANASRSSRLTRLRSTAPPTLRDTDRPRRGRSVVSFGNVYSTRWRLAVERPCRYTRSNSALRDSRPRLGDRGFIARPSRSAGQALAALVPTALQRQPSSPRAHARAEPVRARPLALLWLVGALHARRSGPGTSVSRPASRSCAARRRSPSIESRPTRDPAPSGWPNFLAKCDQPPSAGQEASVYSPDRSAAGLR